MVLSKVADLHTSWATNASSRCVPKGEIPCTCTPVDIYKNVYSTTVTNRKKKEGRRVGERQPKYPATEECINKVRHSHTTGYIAKSEKNQ